MDKYHKSNPPTELKSVVMGRENSRKGASSPAPCYRCVWKEDEDGSWWSDCENGFIFNDAGPHENQFKFCPYCGKKITVNLFRDNVKVDTRDLSRCRPTPCSAPASGQTRTIGIHIFGPYLMYLVGDNKWENQRFHNKLFWRFGYETKKARELYWLTRRINPSQLKPNLPKRSFGAKLSQLFCIPLVKIALSDFYNDIILRRNPRPYSD